ncbi:MAG: NAD(P)H-dependent oxidoreductase subunit E [Candidatus Thorarchaeota archaeon]
MNQEIAQKISEKEKVAILEILKNSEGEKGNLISILQSIQAIYNYLPIYVLNYISEELKRPLAEIFSVATFYTQFKFQPLGKNHIICCDGTACHVKKGPLLLNWLESDLGIKSGETTEDHEFSIESVACLGCCAISPVCVINGKIYGELTPKKLRKIMKKLKQIENQ